MRELNDIIRQAIARTGVISFADFMSLALYHPEHGYYERATSVIGKRGDFFTSVSVGELFGTLLAAQFQAWHASSEAAPWQILEAGAHDGQLAKDILTALQDKHLDTEGPVAYWILEPSVRRQARQQATLRDFTGHVRWFPTWEALPATGVHGIIFANELLDALPVHRLGWDAPKQTWFEWGVAVNKDDFSWAKMELQRDQNRTIQHSNTGAQWLFPLPSEGERARERGPIHRLCTNVSRFNLNEFSPPPALSSVLPDQFTIEVCPQALVWWQQAARALRSGHLLTFDYGLHWEQVFMPERAGGTLRAYYRHHLSPDPLAHPGEQDLTAPVNWTWLQAAGEDEGLTTEGLFRQAQFLTRIVEGLSRNPDRSIPWTPSRLRQFQTLTHPEHLGHAFQVLAQSRIGAQ